jgi:NitT/TauT family transport system permease protein
MEVPIAPDVPYNQRRSLAGGVRPEAATFERDIVTDVRAAKRRSLRNVWLIRVVALAAFLGVWSALPALGLVRKLFVSDPTAVGRRLEHLVTVGSTWTNVWETFEAALIALGIGAALGVLCGVVFAAIPTLARALNPYVSMFNALPRPALAPLFILWFGLGVTAKVFVGVSIVFFILLLNTMAGLSNVDPDIAVLTNSLGATRIQKFVHVELPTALPSIVAGLRLGAVYSVLGVVVSEIVASYHGLGTMLVQSTNGFDVTGTFAILILITGVATVLDVLVRLLERRLQRRTAPPRRRALARRL